MLDGRHVAAPGIGVVAVEIAAEDEPALVRLRDIEMADAIGDDRVEIGLDAFRHEGLQHMAFDRQLHAGHLRDLAGVAGSGEAEGAHDGQAIIEAARGASGDDLDRMERTLDRAGGAIRDKFGRDASGAYHFDKLQPDEQAALVDAYHNAPGLVGRGVTEAIRDGDYMKAFWEMKENVKDPFNPRRMDDARPFLANHSPVENLFNSDSYTTGVLNKAGEEISRAMAGSGDGNGSAPDVTSPAWKESPNMFNSDSYRANMLNASEEELHKAGY